MALPDPILQNRESRQAQEELVMRKDVEESTGTVFDIVRRTEVDVEDRRGTNARRTVTTDPATGDDRRRMETGARHYPSRRPRWGLAGERPS